MIPLSEVLESIAVDVQVHGEPQGFLMLVCYPDGAHRMAGTGSISTEVLTKFMQMIWGCGVLSPAGHSDFVQ